MIFLNLGKLHSIHPQGNPKVISNTLKIRGININLIGTAAY